MRGINGGVVGYVCGLLVGVLVVTHDLFGVICKQ